MYVLLALLTLVRPSDGLAEQAQCGIDCAAVQAALEWAIDRVPAENRGRMFVEVGFRRPGDSGPETPELRARRRALEEVATRQRIPTVPAGKTAMSHPCLTDLATPPCAPGTTWLTITNVREASKDEVLVNVRKIIATGKRGERSHAEGDVTELRLRKAGNVWRIVESRMILHAG